MPEAKFYKDIDPTLRIDPSTGDINVLKDEDSVMNSIKNLVLTQKGEALFNIYRGTNLRKLLFENINAPIIFRIEQEIRFVIKNYEPRVRNLRVKIYSRPEQNLLSAKISFQIIGSAQTNTITLNLNTLR